MLVQSGDFEGHRHNWVVQFFTLHTPVPTLQKMAGTISYDRYTELLGQRIHRTITPAEAADVTHFETAQPVDCPKCNIRVRSQFMPEQIAHDIEKCAAT